MPSKKTTDDLAAHLVTILRAELTPGANGKLPAAVDHRTREVLACFLADQGGEVTMSLERMRRLPADLRFVLDVTDDAAYRLRLMTPDGHVYSGNDFGTGTFGPSATDSWPVGPVGVGDGR